MADRAEPNSGEQLLRDLLGLAKAFRRDAWILLSHVPMIRGADFGAGQDQDR
jgi:hypothetical protein